MCFTFVSVEFLEWMLFSGSAIFMSSFDRTEGVVWDVFTMS